MMFAPLCCFVGSKMVYMAMPRFESRHIGENCAPILDTLFATLVSPVRLLPMGKCDSARSLPLRFAFAAKLSDPMDNL